MNEIVKAKFNSLLAFARKQLNETSTIRGLVVALGSLGALGKFDADVVLPFALLLSSIVAILLPDKFQ